MSLSHLATAIFLQVASTSSIVQAQIDAQTLELITTTADRICGVVKDTGSASSAAAKGVVNTELRGLASQLGTAGVQGSGEITTDEYQNVFREQLAPLLAETAKCKLLVFQRLVVKLIISPAPPSRAKPTTLPCQVDQVTDWLSRHGAYGDRNIDISIYADEVNWTSNGKLSKKTRSEIGKDEEEFRKVYPMQRYFPTASSVAVVGGRCVLTQQLEGYKKRFNGKVELDTYKVQYDIRTDAEEPRIIGQQIGVLPGR
jgi:hypothetical protein